MGIGRRAESGTSISAAEATSEQRSQQHDKKRAILGELGRCGGNGLQRSQLNNRILQRQTRFSEQHDGRRTKWDALQEYKRDPANGNLWWYSCRHCWWLGGKANELSFICVY
jgi:hypothetical protein